MLLSVSFIFEEGIIGGVFADIIIVFPPYSKKYFVKIGKKAKNDRLERA